MEPINIDCQSEDKLFQIDKNEAKALYKYLSKEFITREPYEEFELIMRVINGLATFIDEQ